MLTAYEQAQQLITGYIDAVLPRLGEAMTEKVRAIRERVEAGDDWGALEATFAVDDLMAREPERLTQWDTAVHSWLSAMVERPEHIRDDNDGALSGITPLDGGTQLDFLRRLVAEAEEACHITRAAQEG